MLERVWREGNPPTPLVGTQIGAPSMAISMEAPLVKSLRRVRLFATPWTVCSLPGFSLHGILQARILEWVTISFSRGSSQPRDWTQVSRIEGRNFNLWATREALSSSSLSAIRVMSSAYLNVIDISPNNLDFSLGFIQPSISHDVVKLKDAYSSEEKLWPI